jgi:hypothetical protein
MFLLLGKILYIICIGFLSLPLLITLYWVIMIITYIIKSFLKRSE